MTWKVEHKFPEAKDEYEIPIDYPTPGHDTIIASWFTDVFISVLAMQDALGYDIRGGYANLNVRLSGRLFHTRIVGATPDFTETDFIDDDTERYLDLSGIIPDGTKAVMMNMMFFGAPDMFRAFYSVVAGADMFNDGYVPADPPLAVHLIFSVDETKRIAYTLEPGGAPDFALVSIVDYFK